MVINGELFYKKDESEVATSVGTGTLFILCLYTVCVCVCVCLCLSKVRFILNRTQLFKECHKGPTSDHLGTKRTLARVTERFIWPGVGKDVNNLVSTCHHYYFKRYLLNLSYNNLLV